MFALALGPAVVTSDGWSAFVLGKTLAGSSSASFIITAWFVGGRNAVRFFLCRRAVVGLILSGLRALNGSASGICANRTGFTGLLAFRSALRRSP